MQEIRQHDDIVLPPIKYEYLDHPADVQLHAWGDSLEESFEQVAMAMFAYITDMEYVEMRYTHEIEVEGIDMLSLLFQFLDEFLFIFCAEPFFISKVRVNQNAKFHLLTQGINFYSQKVKILEFDKNSFKIKARGYGEPFNLRKHKQGTEVKAITYSNMQVHEDLQTNDVFVIVDI